MRSTTPIYINGRFLSKPITGTERFAREIMWALDAELHHQRADRSYTILAPLGTSQPKGLKYINFSEVGTKQGHVWEQWELFRAARKGFLVNLTNSAPVLHDSQLTIIHDAAVYRTPQNFSRSYRTCHALLGHILARRSHIGTVSAFSRKELARILHLREEAIPVIPNGHEHMLRSDILDASILEKLNLVGRPFFFFVGSPTPNKNLARAIEAFSSLNHPSASFVIVGAAKTGLFANGISTLPDNVILPGRLSDAEIAALYRNASAMVFPSLYEGFGIPPLEAMVHGCPVIASHIPPIQEVCGDAALYFNPYAPEAIAERMKEVLSSPSLRAMLIAKGKERYPLFSWKQSAQKLLHYLHTEMKG